MNCWPPCIPPHCSSSVCLLPLSSPPLQSLTEFQAVLDAQDKQAVPIKQQQALDYVGAVEEAMVGAFPFTVPADYANLPQLRGGGGGGGGVVGGGGGEVLLGCILGLVAGTRTAEPATCMHLVPRCSSGATAANLPPARLQPCRGPLLQGRATVEMSIAFTDVRDNGDKGGKMTMVLDGYNAPVRWV